MTDVRPQAIAVQNSITLWRKFSIEISLFTAQNFRSLCCITASRMGLSQADNYKLSSVSGVRQSPMFAMFV